ncbi:MAG TPA: hypothetical protein VN408_35255 [Actinoplanes sp.]|nr:hypothetical protein [Actinoplanes sp.]
MQPIMDLITERQTTVAATITALRAQIGALTDDLRTAEIEFNDLATTRTTLDRLISNNEAGPPVDGSPDNLAYQQIITAFTNSDSPTMRAKDVCHALGLGTEPKDTEGIRAKLKRLVKRHVLTESPPGQFALIKPIEATESAATSGPDANSNTKPT